MDSSDRNRRAEWLIAIAASAGGLEALSQVLPALPADLNAGVIIVQHRAMTKHSYLEEVLSRHASLPVVTASDGLLAQSRRVYLASAENHLTVGADRRFSHEGGVLVHGLHSAADPSSNPPRVRFATN